MAYSPVLLLGAGTGEATCGILYLASYLRRGGIEAFVRLYDGDETKDEMTRSLAALVARVRPRLVGISLKWFHHVHRALGVARMLRKIDPNIRIVVGGNTASHWWQELHALDCIDDIILGDGERPLLALCLGEPAPPNCVARASPGATRRQDLTYVQNATNSDDVYYSHFADIFLCEQDRDAFSGWVAPGKGCSETCLYCAGSRDNQEVAFGRATPFLRSRASVRRDHQEVAPRTWQLRYDFPGSSAAFLQAMWAGVDLSRHSCTYFLWGKARPELIDVLAQTFAQVHVVLDIGCFSQAQRLELMGRGLLKPCTSDAELLALLDHCGRHANLDVEVSGIAGLPLASATSLAQEVRLVVDVIGRDCVVGYQRLEAQPGALVTEHAARFAMASEARTFTEFLEYFERREPGLATVPMLGFLDEALEAAVQRTAEHIDATAQEHRVARQRVALNARTRLRNTAPSTRRLALGDWLGRHIVPAQLAQHEVTVVRSVNGTSLACVPSLGPRRFRDPTLAAGAEGRVLLAALAAFAEPTTVAQAVALLGAKAKLDPRSAREAIEHLVDGRFLQPE